MPSSEGEDNYRDIEKGSNFAVFLFSLFYLRLFPLFRLRLLFVSFRFCFLFFSHICIGNSVLVSVAAIISEKTEFAGKFVNATSLKTFV